MLLNFGGELIKLLFMDNAKLENSTIYIEDFELPDGSVYTGDAIDKGFGMIEICGKGKAINPNGSSYEGRWEYGKPNGYGIYKFPDGDFHKGFFDDTPNGPGYLCLNTKRAMQLGFFCNGVLDGWAISIDANNNFNCSFLENGRVIENHTREFQWMADILRFNVFQAYRGNMIQCSEVNGYIRFGAPNRTATLNNNIKFEKHAIGFLFSTDGNLYVGLIKNKQSLDGYCIICTPDHRIILGKWKNNEMVKELPLEDVKAGTEIELKMECIRNVIIDNPSSDSDDLPF